MSELALKRLDLLWRTKQVHLLLRGSSCLFPAKTTAMTTRLVILLILSIITGNRAQRDAICSSGDGFYPHEQFCDYYYECEEGVSRLRTCPNGLAFSGRNRGLIENCDYPHRVGCSERGLPLGQAPISTQNCPWQFGLYPHSKSCTRYWQCWNGTATIHLCPLSLLYNEAIHSCDWPDNVPDCQKHPICKETSNGRVSITKSCVRYWQCVGGYPRLQRCAAGLAFNSINLACELAQEVPGCEPTGEGRPAPPKPPTEDFGNNFENES